MLESTIEQALACISSNSQKSRADGLKELKHVLTINKHSHELQTYGEKGYHGIFTALFQAFAIERTGYTRAKTAATRKTALARIEACSATLRTTVEAFGRNIKTKTLFAVVNHIIDALRDSDSEWWQHISSAYLKALRTLLESPAHLEHLTRDKWLAVCDFCLTSLVELDSDAETLASSERVSLFDSSLDRTSRSSSMQPCSTYPQRSFKGQYGARTELEMLVQLLCTSPTSPVANDESKIITLLLEYMLARRNTTTPSSYVLSAFNAVLMKSMTSHVALAQMALVEVLPLLPSVPLSKSTALKAETMVTLELARTVLPHVRDAELLPQVAINTANLVGHLQVEYLKLSEREILHLDDLEFSDPDNCDPMGIPGLAPRLGVTRAEDAWALLRAIATFSILLDDMPAPSLLQGDEDAGDSDSGRPSKRLFQLTRINELIRNSHASSGAEKLLALQLLPSIATESQMSSDDLQCLLKQLNGNILDEQDELQAWTLVAVASITSQRSASCDCLKPLWSTTWSLATRSISSPRTSRAACYLLVTMMHKRLQDETSILEAVDTMLSGLEMNGPSGLTDASLLMWSCLLRRNAISQPVRSKRLSAQLCNWLRTSWVYDSMTDKLHASYLTTIARPQDMINFLLSCTGRHVRLPLDHLHCHVSRLHKAWAHLELDSDLLRYLFKADVRTPESPVAAAENDGLEGLAESSSGDEIILELLRAKTCQLFQFWESLSIEDLRRVTRGTIRMLTSVCVISYFFVRLVAPDSSNCHHELHQVTTTLWRRLCGYFEKSDSKYLLAALDVLGPLIVSLQIPFAKDATVEASLFLALRDCGLVTKPCLQQMNRHAFVDGSAVSQGEAADIDMLSDNASQIDVTANPGFGFLREDQPPLLYPDTVMAARAATIQWLVLLEIEENGSLCITESLVDFLLTLKASDILIWRPIFLKFFNKNILISRPDASRLVDHFASTCLMTWTVQRTEAAQTVCIHLITVLLPMLSLDDSDDLEKGAHDLLDWFSDYLVNKGQGTSRTLSRVATLYHEIITSSSDHVRDETKRAYQQGFVNVLLQGDLRVTYHCSTLLPSIFIHLSPDNHELFFEDIFAQFPLYADWIEGTSVRLFLLGQLASNCDTILRRSIYRIFETAGQVPDSSHYARRCLEGTSRSLQLKHVNELFTMFASQLLFTWLEPIADQAGKTLATIPYTIFSYSSLKDMLLAVQDEIIGQVMLRGQDEEMTEISSILEAPFHDLLKQSFAKAEAYVIAQSISTPPSQYSQHANGERRIKTLLGKASFNERFLASFPSIVAIIFQRADEPNVECLKKFSDPDAVANWKAIEMKSPSNMKVPVGQEPCFRAKYLYDELLFSCKRANIPINRLWNSSLVCYVARFLMDTVQPSLGSRQACGVLRKLKALVCIAGRTVSGSYCAPMILHFVRPFLTDRCCRDDALGIFWHVYESRKAESFFGPSFEIGLAISSLLSLRAQEGTPGIQVERRSRPNPWMIRVQAFSEWFSMHLRTSARHFCGSETNTLTYFEPLIQLTMDIEGSGNSHKETPAGKLLLLLLDDQAASTPVLQGPAKEQVFDLLGQNFLRERQPKWDILGDDENAVAHAFDAWRCRSSNGGQSSYELWVARALGRAYAASGKLHDSLLWEQSEGPHERSPDRANLSSKVMIIKVLYDTLMSSDPKHVGYAERTLQLIAQHLRSNTASADCKKAMTQLISQSFNWAPYSCPPFSLASAEVEHFRHGIRWSARCTASEWAREVSILLCLTKPHDIVLGSLSKILHDLPNLAECLLPYIIHDVLVSEFDGKQTSRLRLSAVFNQAFRDVLETPSAHIKLIIRTILYLRTQIFPRESNADDRDFWLDIDYQSAALAACHCELYKTALLLTEVHLSHLATTSRRGSAGAALQLPIELLSRIFNSLDDPDLTHGLGEEVNPQTILQALTSCGSSFQQLSFQTASYDADIQLAKRPSGTMRMQIVKTLDDTNLQGIASDLLAANNHALHAETMLSTALCLQQWDIPVPSTNATPSANVFKVLKCLNTQNDAKMIHRTIDEAFEVVAGRLKSARSPPVLKDCMRALASLTEIDEVISGGPDTLRDEWARMLARNQWLKFESYADIKQLLLAREAVFSSLAYGSPPSSAFAKVNSQTCREIHFRTVQESLRIGRDHDESQVALKSAVLMMKLVPICEGQGLSLSVAAQFELAQVLWDRGETTKSIGLLKRLASDSPKHQTVEVNAPRILSTLGQHLAEARLQDATEIRDDYLNRAASKLLNDASARNADKGQIFHDFAVFCDQQVSNQDAMEDLRRLESIRNRKQQELCELESMLVTAPETKKRDIRSHRDKTKAWFELDNAEWQSHKEKHVSLMTSAIVNYLRSLADCDVHKNDVLRFCALWLDNAGNDIINDKVLEVIESVPSRRFAPLVNQLFSRLSDDGTKFQRTLHDLLFRTCVDHPYHGMYQVFMSSKSMTGADDAGTHRYRAANILADRLKADSDMGTRWVSIHNANVMYVKFAMERADGRVRSGSKLSLAKSPSGSKMAVEIPTRRLPPPTLHIQLRDDCDYSQVPVVTGYLPEYTFASGISAPKIVTAVASDGKRYKQLFKGGNDDLRQDLIMEQVFEQVSGLLREHRETRQRKLGIRTYKVVPITTNTGIIEFVQNTLPLNDYLVPAHASHFPRDITFKSARQMIADVQLKSSAERLKAYKRVTNNFHPVLRFFFMERFMSPDDWFEKRLAYTRSTAAISILGHILGLGDRHGHNILLDEQTGEVVHIDLGVAFEQGRVLPIPEVVPFRLTRDLVDGMGITKTEGVFRRSCEFTLEVLRREAYSIMTILDVLRYDPLYSWSLSPLRAKKMQDTQEAGDVAGGGKRANEPSEADRALKIVAKKLGKALSVSATVNELIQQATDERNLSVLFCGWAAFA